MKKLFISIIAVLALLTSCVDLERHPLTDGSSENWFNNAQEVEMALNELYGENYWYMDTYRLYNTDRWTDDWHQRTTVYDFLKGEVSSTWTDAERHYKRYYQAVARANTIISGIEKAKSNLSQDQINQYTAEACFFRAVAYSYLTFLWGDVPFYTDYVDLDDAYQQGKTDKKVILEQIYKDFGVAVDYLPSSYASVKRITKGAAYAFWARTALWNQDWAKVVETAEACIATGEFALEADFEKLFWSETKSNPEFVFFVPRAAGLTLPEDLPSLKSFMPRIMGGTATANPSIELFSSFICSDGKTIDQSSVFDPDDPWKNRDPRLAATIVEPGTKLLGYTIDPRPWVKEVENNEGQKVKNKDTRSVDEHAAHNGLNLRKGISPDWMDDKTSTHNVVVMRYSNVLLMLAEAKCELGQIDDEALNAINQVRARAWKCGVNEINKYPAVTTKDQAEFRTQIRLERRMEFAWENHRFFDLMRWRIAEKALTKSMMMLNKDKLKNVAKDGAWFFSAGVYPEVDKDGIVDAKVLEGKNCFTQEAFGVFDASKQYLFPFPADVMEVCPNIMQNPNY